MQSIKITILHLVSWYPSKVHSTLGNFVAEHIFAIQNKTEGAVLGAFAADENSLDYSVENGVAVCRVYYQQKTPFLSYLQALSKGYQHLLALGYKFDLAHLHVAYPAGLFLQKIDLPYVVSEHFSAYQKSRRHDLSLANKLTANLIFNKARYVIPVSQQLGDSLQSFGVKAPIHIIGNVVNTKIFQYQAKAESSLFKILHISSLQESTKNISGIVSAFADFHRSFPQSQLVIGGDGDPSALRKHLQDESLEPNSYRILPSLNKIQVAQEMQESDCFLLFSHIENQPVVILESLCMGRPVIATKVGGIPQLLDESRGILVEPGNTESLISALFEMQKKYRHYEHKKMAHIAQNEFGYKAIAEKFFNLYTSVLRSNASD